MAVLLVIGAVLLFCALLFLAFVGYVGYYGPLRGLAVLKIRLKYRSRPKGEIVFYGASNFTFWGRMEEDMAPLAVQNHGFGGSADGDMIERANQLLFPYQPRTVVFQSGSNDFAKGLNAADICANKDKMYSAFRRQLPNARFVVMSMLPLPGRGDIWPQSAQVNEYLKAYCQSHENMLYLDATELFRTAKGAFRPELFRKDKIHLNRNGQKIWGALIKKALEGVNEE